MRRVAVWTALAAALAAALVFVAVRVAVPSDGARVAFYDGAWSAAGIRTAPIDAPAGGLRPDDTIQTVAGRPMEAWLAAVLDPGIERPAPGTPIDYRVERDGTPTTVTVTWATQPVGPTLLEGWSLLLFSVAVAAVAALVFARRPDAPAAVPLVVAAIGAAGSGVPWFLGLHVSDVVQGGPFVVHALVTGPLYMLMWPASLHLALVFPAPHRVLHRHPGLVPLVYAAALGGHALALAAGRLVSPTLLEWVGMWPVAQSVVIIPTLGAAVLLLAYRFLTTTDPVAQVRVRWASLGAAAAGALGLGLYWLPQVLLGHTLADASWMGLVALPFPLGLAAGIVRDRLFDIDVVVRRSLVYGGLTAAVLASYTIVVTVLGSVAGPEHGPGIALLATGIAALVALPVRDVLQRAVTRLLYGERAEPWRAVRRLGRQLEWAGEPERALPAIVDEVAAAMRVPYVGLTLTDLEGEGGGEHAGERGGRHTVERGARQGPTIDVPLVHAGEEVGRLELGLRAGEDRFRPDELRLLEDLARQAGAAAHAQRLRADLARSRERIVVAREEERRRLRRDLHDGLGPSLAAIGVRAEAAAALLADDPDRAARLLDELGSDVRTALADIRRLVDGLRPPALDELGLLGAIRQQAERLGGEDGAPAGGLRVSVEAEPDPLPDLPAAVEVAAYRIALEAVTNTVRHAGASTCRVRLRATDGTLAVEVVDDGRGTGSTPAAGRTGVGLDSIRERTGELGGTWRIEAAPGGGTRVEAVLPLADRGTPA